MGHIAGMWRGVVVTLAICSGLSILSYLVAASGTIGLEHREDMCRLEFIVCMCGHGEGGG